MIKDYRQQSNYDTEFNSPDILSPVKPRLNDNL